MSSLLIAGRITPTNVALLEAARDAGEHALLLPPDSVSRRVQPGDLVLGRVDVARTLDGVEPGLGVLRRLERLGVLVLNRAATLRASHDKLVTARLLHHYGIPHPETVLVRTPDDVVPFAPPYVVKPRFGSWGADVVRCATREELRATLRGVARRRWFRRRGALVQQLVPTTGEDLRLLVAAGVVVGAIARVAAPGEWRTNVSLGGTRRPAQPSAAAAKLAVAAAGAVGGDLVGIDLLKVPGGGYVVLEVNGCVDFAPEYGLSGNDVFGDVARALCFPCWAAELQHV